MLTQSNNDHEALAAIRKANQLLAVHNLNWEQYLGVAMRLDEDEERNEEAKGGEIKKSRYQKTMDMIQVVKEHLTRRESPAIDFILSLEQGLIEWGSLTPNQMNALKKFYKNASAARERAPF